MYGGDKSLLGSKPAARLHAAANIRYTVIYTKSNAYLGGKQSVFENGLILGCDNGSTYMCCDLNFARMGQNSSGATSSIICKIQLKIAKIISWFNLSKALK